MVLPGAVMGVDSAVAGEVTAAAGSGVIAEAGSSRLRLVGKGQEYFTVKQRRSVEAIFLRYLWHPNHSYRIVLKCRTPLPPTEYVLHGFPIS